MLIQCCSCGLHLPSGHIVVWLGPTDPEHVVCRSCSKKFPEKPASGIFFRPGTKGKPYFRRCPECGTEFTWGDRLRIVCSGCGLRMQRRKPSGS